MNLRSILKSNKLTGSNFSNWLWNMRVVLRSEKILFVINEATPEVPLVDALNEDLITYNRYKDTRRWSHAWCWPQWYLIFKNSMSIWMLRRSWCIYKSCLVHNFVMRGFRPQESCFSKRWLKGHQWMSMCTKWSIWLRNWHDWDSWWTKN